MQAHFWKIGVLVISLFASAALISGCESLAKSQGSGPGFGDATLSNGAVQVVDPHPAMAKGDAPDMDGKRAALAIDRYHTGKTIKPEQMRTRASQGSAGQ